MPHVCYYPLLEVRTLKWKMSLDSAIVVRLKSNKQRKLKPVVMLTIKSLVASKPFQLKEWI